MRKPMAKKVLAASMAAAMTMSVAACGDKAPASTPAPAPEVEASTETPAVEEEVSKYTVLKDANGNVLDLGGIEVTIYDWFTTEKEPETNYERELAEYRDWVQETYNFTVVSDGSGDWGECANQFVDYVNGNGDEKAYVWAIYGENATLLSAAVQGLCYDLSTIDSPVFNLNDRKYTSNMVHDLYTFGGGTWGMHAGPSEPRMGMFFNKAVLRDAGIDPESIYDMQANDTWTWEAFEDMLEKTTRDTDNDGEIDVWGLTVNETNFTVSAVYSNNGDLVKTNAAGEYEYAMEDPETVEALEWTMHIFKTYDWDGPVDENGATQWDYYKEQFVNGGAAFCADETWIANAGATFDSIEELGFVMFPKGPKGRMVQAAKDNVYVIPGCYDADKAEKIATAFDIWNEYVPGYEDFNPFVNSFRTGNYDTRACEETVPLMGENAVTPKYGLIPNNSEFIYSNFMWQIGPNSSSTISELLEANRELAQQCIAEANAR